jgi:hypothetical protein
MQLMMETINPGLKKFLDIGSLVLVIGLIIGGYLFLNRKSPEERVFEEQVNEVSLENKVEEFEILEAKHIGPDETAEYNTNPPTSGMHWEAPANWGFYTEELSDEQVVHNLEHGGIWISYKNLDSDSLDKLKEIASKNPNSLVVSKREVNEDNLVVASWGKWMKLSTVDEVLIQKYIDTYINQSPEKLSR